MCQNIRLKNKLPFLCVTLLLATITQQTYGLSSNANQPYYVSADSINYNKHSRTTTYSGHVKMTQGTTRVTGNKAFMILNKKNQIVKVIVFGELAHYRTLPAHEKTPLDAKAKKIIYEPSKNTVLLLGKGRVELQENVFTGPHIWYDIKKGEVKSKALSPHQQTTIIIQPQNKERR